MGVTPDRHPGPREEEKITLTSEEGYVADGLGDMVFNGSEFVFKDSIGQFNPRDAGTGITEGEHELLDTLVHWISETSYDEITRICGKAVSIITWETPAKLKKVRETQITRVAGRVSQVVDIQYNAIGVEKMRVTEVLTRGFGRKILSITRTKV